MASWHADFNVGEWRVSPKLHNISKEGKTVVVKHKSMAVLVSLADANGDVVSRDDIMDMVWPRMAVTDDVLTQSIVELRKAFNDDAKHPKFIETIPKVGFRLLASVSQISEDQAQKSLFPTDGSKHADRGLPKQGFFHAATVLLFIVFALWFLLGKEENVRRPVITVEETPTMVVLPFVNLSDDPDTDYFSDGLSDEIRNLLSETGGLKVIGRASSFAFKGKNEDLRVIGSTLGVQNVLEGTVRTTGDQVRVTAQLIDVSDGTQVWSGNFNRTMTDIFAMQDDIAAAIIAALHVNIGMAPTRGRPTESLEAYTLFLKAKASIHPKETRSAESNLKAAIELDPDFAEAYELLAWVYWNQVAEVIAPLEAQALTVAAATEALSRNPDLVFARALHLSSSGEANSFLEILQAYEQAVFRQPYNQAAHSALIFDLVECGYLQEALSIAKRSVEIDPLSLAANSDLIHVLYATGQTAEAEALLKVFEELSPIAANWIRGDWSLAAQQDDIAIAHYEAHLRQHGLPSGWVRETVTAARNPATGQAYLDRRIPQIIASMPQEDAHGWRQSLNKWYLLFGFADRHIELIFDYEMAPIIWSTADELVFDATVFRHLGFTAHPRYLEIAQSLGIVDIWDQRGAPDFCKKLDGQWVCE
ncbi:MAG: hypothetical protein GTO71_04795 [Woeseiaceae bacterium]|nr:hypothetical protein [Woeseiaceae bacterium]NIP20416.1 hypothetical protein [Woeseiaceae bacterium]NIS89305.1 hypothetical protein [Woeseiaceae bacterium]